MSGDLGYMGSVCALLAFVCEVKSQSSMGYEVVEVLASSMVGLILSSGMDGMFLIPVALGQRVW